MKHIKLLSKLLRETADKLDAGTCEIDSEQAIEIANMFSHEPLSKYQACQYLNMSRSSFDRLVQEGKLPMGHKRAGYTEKFWYRDQLVVKE